MAQRSKVLNFRFFRYFRPETKTEQIRLNRSFSSPDKPYKPLSQTIVKLRFTVAFFLPPTLSQTVIPKYS